MSENYEGVLARISFELNLKEELAKQAFDEASGSLAQKLNYVVSVGS